LAALAKNGIGCTLRGSGYSQSGQSVACDTVTLATRRLDQIGVVDPLGESVSVGAGATPRQLMFGLKDASLAPPVLPLNPDMSFGGLLSAGGVGPTSYRNGTVIANVHQIDVVTGNGELLLCSRHDNADLFHWALGGMGQCGLITRATLALRRAPRRVRVVLFAYSESGQWLKDQLSVSKSDVPIHMEGFCWTAAKGLRSTPAGPMPVTQWMYGLQLAIEEEHAAAGRARDVLESLRPTQKIDEHEADYISYLHRYDMRFSGMVRTGAWGEAHPWFEAVVPVEGAEAILQRILECVPAEIGDGHRFTLLDSHATGGCFVAPAGRLSAVIGLFPVAVARSALSNVLRTIDELTGLVLEAGGRRYLSGWLGTDAAGYLRRHFGERYDEWVGVRRRHDSSGVLRSSLFPKGNVA
jgi:cytokinin dehydrogenase